MLIDEPVPHKEGTTVRLSLPGSTYSDQLLAQTSIRMAKYGRRYQGSSSPWWYGATDLHRLCANVTPTIATVCDVRRDLGIIFDDNRTARKLSREDIEAVLEKLRACVEPLPPKELGFIRPEFQPKWPGYALKADLTTMQSGVQIPFVVEAWAYCSRSIEKGQGSANIQLAINRSMTLARIHATSSPSGIRMRGCDINRQVHGPGTGSYQILLSLITPFVQLAGDGKEPVLRAFSSAIAHVISKACGAAHRAMARPKRSMNVKPPGRSYPKPIGSRAATGNTPRMRGKSCTLPGLKSLR